jgi:hypothetical protein
VIAARRAHAAVRRARDARLVGAAYAVAAAGREPRPILTRVALRDSDGERRTIAASRRDDGDHHEHGPCERRSPGSKHQRDAIIRRTISTSSGRNDTDGRPLRARNPAVEPWFDACSCGPV